MSSSDAVTAMLPDSEERIAVSRTIAQGFERQGRGRSRIGQVDEQPGRNERVVAGPVRAQARWQVTAKIQRAHQRSEPVIRLIG